MKVFKEIIAYFSHMNNKRRTLVWYIISLSIVLIEYLINSRLDKLVYFHPFISIVINIVLLIDLFFIPITFIAIDILKNSNKLQKEVEKFEISTFLSGKYDQNNAIITIHPGAGGTESQDWAEMLYRMYQRYCSTKDFKIEVLDYLDGDVAGIKSVTFLVKGKYAYGHLKAEKGVHRLVRISPFDSSKRRHTSFASIDVIPELDDTIEIDIKPEDLRIDTYRASGAGGQHINKTDSAVRITHIPTGTVVTCQSQRSQIQNREQAMMMLKSKLFALMEEKQAKELKEIQGEQKEIAWGSQIRSYVLHPYSLVKDNRSLYESNNPKDVLDGNLDDFIYAYLKYRIQEGSHEE